MNIELSRIISDIQNKSDFSGAILVQDREKVLVDTHGGYANRSAKLENNSETRFGIASGCKLFTAIAICQLVEEGKVSLDSKLSDCLSINFKHFDEGITVHHLLTHTSGIPDYFDEEVMKDFEELWVKRPMYHVRMASDFLPLFQHEPMKSQVGERFHYNNAGYILLGLIIEQVSGLEFSDYIQKYIFTKANITNSGYFSFDSLPSNTSLGYIDNPDGTWKTNIYSLPAKGGPDGGAYVTVSDMVKLWEALFNNQLLSETYTNKVLTAHVQVNETGFYGYGVWIKKSEDSVLKYHIMGYDPGVSFHSAYYPGLSMKVAICSNKSEGAFDILKGIEEKVMNGPRDFRRSTE
ncbi:serine hydrolase domain-containing protein [Halobacillus seohaensis]|uniref:Serine hydrolase domain-containing protein n=1 Tax=Halobacillus seohaensis TaxID=447421 RepID=A0ABW2EM72_9BACI